MDLKRKNLQSNCWRDKKAKHMNCGIKGNNNAKGNKIYHMPGQLDYENTVEEIIFCTVEEAKGAGFIPAAR